MQVEIVRHHGRTKNPNADVKHSLVYYNVWARHKPGKNTRHARFGKNQLGGETTSDHNNQGDDNGFDVTKPFCLEIKDSEHIQRGDNAAPHQGNTEKELETYS